MISWNCFECCTMYAISLAWTWTISQASWNLRVLSKSWKWRKSRGKRRRLEVLSNEQCIMCRKRKRQISQQSIRSDMHFMYFEYVCWFLKPKYSHTLQIFPWRTFRERVSKTEGYAELAAKTLGKDFDCPNPFEAIQCKRIWHTGHSWKRGEI